VLENGLISNKRSDLEYYRKASLKRNSYFKELFAKLTKEELGNKQLELMQEKSTEALQM
jgi:hypothetical protein